MRRLAMMMVLCCWLWSGNAAAVEAAAPIAQTGVVTFVNDHGGWYGITGDDGRRYQPLNLPRELRKNGQVVIFQAVPQEAAGTLFYWGEVVRLDSIRACPLVLETPERTAIGVWQRRMAALNQRSLKALQAVDRPAQNLTDAQFNDWLGNYDYFALRYVEIDSASDSIIRGKALYSRERRQSMSVRDGDGITQLDFTLERQKQGWVLIETKNVSEQQLFAWLSDWKNIVEKKYGTRDLQGLWESGIQK